ncbi:MAG: metallophosphoesterase [Planctomycetes bacterium]|nr:metallophosphoesterase [Planctomycetota bacterium]
MRRVTAIRLGVVAALVLGALFSPLLSPLPLATGPFVQAVTADAAVVRCVTAAAEARGLVVRTGDEVVQRVAAGEARTEHRFPLRGLSPATRYDYELVDAAGQRLDRGSFRTMPDRDDASVRFAVLGDSGDQPFWIDLQRSPLVHALSDSVLPQTAWAVRRVGEQLAALAPDFWLHTGDVVYPKGVLPLYRTGFFEPFREVLREAPCLAVPGNHDVLLADGSAYDFVFEPAGRVGAGRSWSQRIGPVRLVGLDLNAPLTADSPQLTVLRDAAAAGEPWLMVASHYPIATVYRDAPRPDLVELFLPLCRELGVDVVFAGHDHLYQRFGAADGAGPIEVGTGGGGKDLYEIRQRPDGLAAAQVAHHACVVDVRGVRLTLEARDIDGGLIDRFELDARRHLAPGAAPIPPSRRERIEALSGE